MQCNICHETRNSFVAFIVTDVVRRSVSNNSIRPDNVVCLVCTECRPNLVMSSNCEHHNCRYYEHQVKDFPFTASGDCSGVTFVAYEIHDGVPYPFPVGQEGYAQARINFMQSQGWLPPPEAEQASGPPGNDAVMVEQQLLEQNELISQLTNELQSLRVQNTILTRQRDELGHQFAMNSIAPIAHPQRSMMTAVASLIEATVREEVQSVLPDVCDAISTVVAQTRRPGNDFLDRVNAALERRRH